MKNEYDIVKPDGSSSFHLYYKSITITKSIDSCAIVILVEKMSYTSNTYSEIMEEKLK